VCEPEEILVLESVGTPTLWVALVAAVLALLALDFVITRRPHEVSMREAVAWSTFYVALPLAFGMYVWRAHGSQVGLEYYTGYLVEKSLSVDNLFVFILILGAFAVPRHLQQRVLLYGIVGALALRAVFIALGAAALAAFDWVFLVFGVILLLTAVKILRDALRGGDHQVDVDQMRLVRLLRRWRPVTGEYDGARLSVQTPDGARALTPLALVVAAVLAADVVFAVDSVPAVYGITEDPFLVFATNAFALLGLRALYFVLESVLGRLRHLPHGLGVILAFIGVKLVLHWAHDVWAGVPTVPTLWSLAVVLLVLVTATVTSLVANRRAPGPGGEAASEQPLVAPGGLHRGP